MTTANRNNAGALALLAARRLTGEPYLFGGVAPGPTDCSGLVQWAWGQVGVPLARDTYDQYIQWPIGNSVASQPGDLLFIPGSDAIGNKPGHVMMYVSPGQVFQAPYTGQVIGQTPYDTSQFEFRTRPALALPLPPIPTPEPSQAVLAAHGLMLVNGPQAKEALKNNWPLYVWNTLGFTDASTLGPLPVGTHEYASIHWASKNPV